MYDEKREEISAITVANRLRMLKQDGKPMDEYIILYEDTRDRIPANQLAPINTHYNHAECLVGDLDPQLLNLYVQDNRMFRNETWEGTTKEIREPEIKLKLGVDQRQ